MTKVLYIAGAGRSGSTLLERVIGRAEGAMAVGEVRHVWRRGLIENRLCGCGERFRSCAFWSAALEQAGVGAADAATIERSITEVTRVRNLPAVLRQRGRTPAIPTEAERHVSGLYAAIAKVSGVEVVIDSSKLPTYAALLDRLPELDVRVLHLVRDPRGTAFSWKRPKALVDKDAPTVMEQRGAAKTAVLWSIWNVIPERLWRGSGRYARLRYEDFVVDPDASLRSALGAVGFGDLHVPIVDHRVDLTPDHTVAGNPDRLRNGVVEIRADERWRSDAPASERALVTALTAPLLSRFGYSLRISGR